ncbi:hypothetical protein HNQ94_000917 [Salirhabdus euzebyi]|uniref:Uncharacterized protein n=1 Tax=Salirhabdus euzebyi TaxID=394506 RepID=A0A841Q247_9BACI|nr:hypothetical protein [Salirhabdus euzebyi]MBB6452472.1 hypothetical protein [Salirhabdus euzebyi]
MKKILILFFIIFILLFLPACNNDSVKENTFSKAELTEREKAILSTTADQSFVFDFHIDSEYKEVSVWVEKYELGELVDNKIAHLTAKVKENGTIIFTKSNTIDNDNQVMFNVGINSDGATGSLNSFDTMSGEGFRNMSIIMDSNPGESIPTTGKMVLASICYSNDDGSMSSLPHSFFQDVEGNISDLEKYDVAYLIKSEFIK